MKIAARTATFAVAVFCAGALASATTPGFASALQDVTIQVFNAEAAEEVPTVEDTQPLPQVADQVPPLVELTPKAPAAETRISDLAADDDTEFASLSQAVAAQETADTVDRELNCLAIGVYYESKGEPLAGQLAVAEVILNRTQSGRFPRTVCGVLTQRGQFSFVRGGALPTPPRNAQWRKALAVAKVASKDLWDSPVPDALFFHANYVSPKWRRARVGTVGNHIFYR